MDLARINANRNCSSSWQDVNSPSHSAGSSPRTSDVSEGSSAGNMATDVNCSHRKRPRPPIMDSDELLDNVRLEKRYLSEVMANYVSRINFEAASANQAETSVLTSDIPTPAGNGEHLSDNFPARGSGACSKNDAVNNDKADTMICTPTVLNEAQPHKTIHSSDIANSLLKTASWAEKTHTGSGTLPPNIKTTLPNRVPIQESNIAIGQPLRFGSNQSAKTKTFFQRSSLELHPTQPNSPSDRTSRVDLRRFATWRFHQQHMQEAAAELNANQPKVVFSPLRRASVPIVAYSPRGQLDLEDESKEKDTDDMTQC